QERRGHPATNEYNGTDDRTQRTRRSPPHPKERHESTVWSVLGMNAPLLTIYVDADACPVKDEVYKVARRYRIHVAVVANAALRVPPEALIELVIRPGFGAADDWIAERAGPGAVVVTADIPLAARCLAKEALVLDPKGRQRDVCGDNN